MYIIKYKPSHFNLIVGWGTILLASIKTEDTITLFKTSVYSFCPGYPDVM